MVDPISEGIVDDDGCIVITGISVYKVDSKRILLLETFCLVTFHEIFSFNNSNPNLLRKSSFNFCFWVVRCKNNLE